MIKRSHIPVNGRKILQLRQECGWTQCELARRSGYSVRLIRKAEAMGSLRIQTVNDIALTFASQGLSIKADELVFDQLAIAKLIVARFDHWGCHLLNESDAYLSDKLEVSCVTSISEVAFAGRWTGHSAVSEFLAKFYCQFSRMPGSISPIYLSGQDCVVARFEESLYFHGNAIPKFFVNLHFQFSGLIVTRIDYEGNFHFLLEQIEAIRNRVSASSGIRLTS